MKKKTMFMIGLVAVALTANKVLTSCGQKDGMGKGDKEYPVIGLNAQADTLVNSYPATIKGIQDVEVRPKISGFVTKIYVHEGQKVNAGQPLFAIDSETYQAAVRQAQAGVKTAEAQLSTVTLSYENSKKLFEKGVIGQYEMSAAENSYATAQAGLAQAQAALVSAKQTLDWCNIASPVSGVVGDIPYKVGNLVSASNVLTTVSSNNSMEVYFSMSENEVLTLTKKHGSAQAALDNMPAVRLKLIDGKIYEHEGKVTKMSGVINATTGSVQFIALFDNPDNLLRSGGAGQVILPRHNAAAIVVPQSACSQVQDKVFVFKLANDDSGATIAKHTEIKVDPQNDGNNYVVVGGELTHGDSIVVKGITKLKDGDEVVPITEARYEEKLEEAAELAKKQGSVSGFMKIMKKSEVDKMEDAADELSDAIGDVEEKYEEDEELKKAITAYKTALNEFKKAVKVAEDKAAAKK